LNIAVIEEEAKENRDRNQAEPNMEHCSNIKGSQLEQVHESGRNTDRTLQEYNRAS
jgi:hypothetical protein